MAAIKFIKRTVALDGSNISENLPATFFNDENAAHSFVITAQRDGANVPLSGSVSAVFLNPNDQGVALTGSISNGAAVITLSDACYHVTGRFTLTISVNGAVIYECNSRIKRRSSGTGYDPTSQFDVATLAASIAAMQAATVQAQIATNAANAVVNDIITGQPINLNWVVGNINSTDGTNKSGYTTRLRIEEYIYSEIGMGAVIPEGMKAYWYKYSSNSAATFIGCSDGWQTGSFTVPGGYYYRFVVAYSDDRDIEASAGSAVTVMDYKYTDTTLTKPGKAADANATGQIFSSYDEGIVPLYEREETGTSSGITYTWSGNTISMSGTARETVFIRRLFYYSSASAHNIPWIKKGNVYHLKLSRTANDGARIRIRTYIGETMIDYFRFSEDATFTLQRADELTYIEIAAYAPGGDTVNNTLTYKLLMSPSLQYLAGKSVNSPLKLRVMQNNIGVFRFGRLPGSGDNKHYEHTAEEAAQKLQNYKKFYSEYRPDILCLQEFYRYIGPNDTVNVNTNLYDQIFAYHEDENSASKQRAIFGNLPCVLDGLKTVTYGGSSLTFMEMTILANNIHVFTTALNSSSGNAAVTTRQNQLEALLTYAEQYNNVIMCLDLNAYSESEHTSMLSTAAQHGFDSTFGGSYWGRHNTYINPPGQSTPMSYYRKIDAIWCKGAMKMVNARTLFDETTHYPDTYVIDQTEVTAEKPNVMAANLYNDLASDHVPIFADIVVYG